MISGQSVVVRALSQSQPEHHSGQTVKWWQCWYLSHLSFSPSQQPHTVGPSHSSGDVFLASLSLKLIRGDYIARFPSMRNMVGAVGRFFNNIKRRTIYPLGSPGSKCYSKQIIFQLSNSLGVVHQARKPSYKPTSTVTTYKPAKPSHKPMENTSYHTNIITLPSPGMRLNNLSDLDSSDLALRKDYREHY